MRRWAVYRGCWVWTLALAGPTLAGSLSPAHPAVSTADPVHLTQPQTWVETRLYFGLGALNAADRAKCEAAWRDFLDHEVTPRFPAGLSVVDAYGQWQDTGAAAPERLHSKVLIIDHPDNRAEQAKLDAIRAVWKARSGDHSVLEVTVPARVSF